VIEPAFLQRHLEVTAALEQHFATTRRICVLPSRDSSVKLTGL